MSAAISANRPAGPSWYIPGYVGAKRAMTIAGILLILAGLTQLWRPLRLVLVGERAQAEVVRAVKEKPGLPPMVLTDNLHLAAQSEPHDPSYTFWNEFRFRTREGREVEVRASVGSQVKPLYPLTDDDGLPTTDWVCYDPADPEHALFPLIISVWLAPCALIFAGLSCAIIGAVLLFWADKPIELPHVGGLSSDPAAKVTPAA